MHVKKYIRVLNWLPTKRGNILQQLLASQCRPYLRRCYAECYCVALL